MQTFLVVLFCVCVCTFAAELEVFDPFNVFCGSRSCYDVLKVERSATTKEIRKAYRELSKTMHPDKVHPDKRVNVTADFIVLKKAQSVLIGNETRPSFDWYLDHPRSYFKATGKHAWRAVPKFPMPIVMLLALGLFSWFFHFVQEQKHTGARKRLLDEVVAGQNQSQGATKMTLDLRSAAAAAYMEYVAKNQDKYLGQDFFYKQCCKKAVLSQPAARSQMLKDPKFAECVEAAISRDVKDWGEYARPTQQDLMVIRMFTVWPGAISAFVSTYHRRYLSSAPLSEEDQLAMTAEVIGEETWDALSATEKKQAVERKVYVSKNLVAWQKSRQEAYLKSKGYKKEQKKMAKMQATNPGQFNANGGNGQDMPFPRDMTE